MTDEDPFDNSELRTMDGKTERVSIRLPPETVDKVDGIVSRYGYRNTSDAIRLAIDEFNKYHSENWNSERMVVEIPLGVVERMDSLVDSGDALSRDDIVREALGRFLDEQEDRFMDRETRLKQLRDERLKRRQRPQQANA